MTWRLQKLRRRPRRVSRLSGEMTMDKEGGTKGSGTRPAGEGVDRLDIAGKQIELALAKAA